MMEQLMDNLFKGVTGMHDRKIVDAIRKYIPGFSMETAADYAFRISIQIPEGKRFPQRYVIDADTPNEVIACEIHEPVIIHRGFTLTATQLYLLYENK